MNKTESMAIAMDKLSARIFSTKFENPYIFTAECVKPNGKLDKNISQGTSNDCWLLAPIIACKQRLNGNSELVDDLEKRIKIPTDSKQNYTVILGNKKYYVSKSELNLSKEYSSGDLDVRLLEIAVNKYMHENNLGDVFSCNYSKKGFEYLWGNNINVKKVKVDESLFEELKTAKAIVLESKSNIDTNITNTEGKSSKIKPLHAYALSEYDENNICIIDPYEEHNKYILSYSDVLQLFKSATIIK